MGVFSVVTVFPAKKPAVGGGKQSRDREGAEVERQERKWSVAASERQSRERCGGGESEAIGTHVESTSRTAGSGKTEPRP